MFIFLSSCSQNHVVQEVFFVPKNDIVFQKADYDTLSNPVKPNLKAFSGIYVFFDDIQPLKKLGFFSDESYQWPPEFIEGYYEEFMDYTAVWELHLANGKKARIIKANKLFFIDYNGKYYFLPTLSHVHKNDVAKWVVNKKVIVDEESRFLAVFGNDFEYPRKITFQSNGENYELDFNYQTFDRSFFPLQKIDELSKKLGKDIFIEPLWKEIELSKKSQELSKLPPEKIEKLDANTKNTYYEELRARDIFAADGIYLKLPDNTYAVYTLKVPFAHKFFNTQYGYEMGNVFHFIANDGEKKDVKDYSYKETESCGTRNGTYLYVNNFSYTFPWEKVYKAQVRNKQIKPFLSDVDYAGFAKFSTTVTFTGSDLGKIGMMDEKYPVYGFKNSQHPFLQAVYDYLLGGEKSSSAYEKFIENTPVFFWNDPFGRTVLFVSYTVSAPEYCAVKPVIYLYPKEKTQIEVTLDWQKKLLRTIPEYTNKWQVSADVKWKITDIKSWKHYPYLFREDLNSFPDVDDGFVVAWKDVESFFDEKLAFMGMGEKEIQDFKKYWLPELKTEPYYFFHFYQNDVLDEIAPITITPKPEKISRILMTYYGMQKPFEVKKQELKAFERTGYFAIERWGRKK